MLGVCKRHTRNKLIVLVDVNGVMLRLPSSRAITLPNIRTVEKKTHPTEMSSVKTSSGFLLSIAHAFV